MSTKPEESHNESDEDNTNLGRLTDDAFYQKLTQLKNEHKKTLNLCEKLYKQKQIMTGQDNKEKSLDSSVDFTAYTSTARANKTHHPYQSKDNLCDLSSKPPTGRQTSSTPLRNSQNFDTSLRQSFNNDGDDILKRVSREAWMDASTSGVL